MKRIMKSYLAFFFISMALGCSDGGGDNNPGDGGLDAGKDDAGGDDGGSDPSDAGGGDPGGDAGEDASGSDAGNVKTVAFATYNAGLATGFVDYADERQPAIGEGVAALEADVVCLQEVWLPEQIEALKSATENTFEHSYVEITQDDLDAGTGDGGLTGGACSEEEIDTFGGCVRDHCSEVETSELTTCAFANCGTEFGNLSSDCVTCVAANIGGTIDEILETCGSSEGGSMTYEGHNGLMLLSKHPLKASNFFVFKSFLNRRVVLHARIDTEALGAVDLFCTHLTANLSSVTYSGEYASWEDERAAQIDTMIDYIDQTKTGTNPVVLMGDMNCGPATDLVEAEFQENYTKFENGGFDAPYLDDPESTCTWCAENPLTGGGHNSIIDHVLMKDMPEDVTYTTKRLLDDPITIESGGQTIDTRLSDHYGAVVEVTK
ncbi:MAG: hypothetical protein GY854_05540 [Deltaproteobacteria bacterium]|nr:hypothetical protein [Deltaproteobacteria bacterium]